MRKNTVVSFVLGASIVTLLNFHFSTNRLDYTGKFDQQIFHNNNSLQNIIQCNDKQLIRSIKQRGTYWVLYNFVPADENVTCLQTITLASPGDFRFLDNIPPLVERWQGPISVALYAPGHDFNTTVKSIAYLRTCTTPLVRKFVSFHVFFDTEHIPTPKHNATLMDSYDERYDCRVRAPFTHVRDDDMYKFQKKLVYPINVARNIAKESVQTYFVFPSDIELYPTPHLIQKFFAFVQRHRALFAPSSSRRARRGRNVFVLPIFEILANESVPDNKTQLQAMIHRQAAFVFHRKVCLNCHKVPNGDAWILAPQTAELDVFSKGKRQERYRYWEPFYICTQNEPLFDERLSWEGQGNKMSQAYSLCLLDYDFLVLNNAFLIHKPGVKKSKVQNEKYGKLVAKSNALLRIIRRELTTLYGFNKKC